MLSKLQLLLRLLDHPFYQKWEKGMLSLNELSIYGYSYLAFIEQIPVWWEKVQQHFNTNHHWVVEEEKEHIRLWKEWIALLPTPSEVDTMQDVKASFDIMSPEELLGALYAFESQQPDVARTKREGLLRFYNLPQEYLEYFDQHLLEERHLAVAEHIAEHCSAPEELRRGFHKGAKILYHSLDRFLQC